MSNMRREIGEQPAIVERLGSDLRPYHRAVETARAADVRFVLFAARGTSDNAAVYGKYLASIFAGLPVGLAAPSALTRYGASLDLRQTLVIGISQSGATPDVTEFVEQAGRRGACTVAITNDESSALAAAARFVLPTGAGEELAVAATKTYTSQLAALALFWGTWSGERQLTAPMAEGLPLAMQTALATESRIEGLASRFAGADRFLAIGRGFTYTTALETALKLTETCALPAMAFSAADFLHGPIVLAEPGLPVAVFAWPGPTEPSLVRLIKELRRRSCEVVTVAPPGAALDAGSFGVALPAEVPEPLAPLVAVIPGQLLAYHSALRRGLDPSRPRGLSKITRTR